MYEILISAIKQDFILIIELPGDDFLELYSAFKISHNNRLCVNSCAVLHHYTALQIVT